MAIRRSRYAGGMLQKTRNSRDLSTALPLNDIEQRSRESGHDSNATVFTSLMMSDGDVWGVIWEEYLETNVIVKVI